jgi:hypothetical protein
MYGISLGSFTSLGLTGNKFFPPAFCHSVRVLDVNVVMPKRGQLDEDRKTPHSSTHRFGDKKGIPASSSITAKDTYLFSQDSFLKVSSSRLPSTLSTAPLTYRLGCIPFSGCSKKQ